MIHCHYGPNGNSLSQLHTLGLVRAPVLTTFHGYDIRLAQQKGSGIYDSLKRYGSRYLAISDYTRRLLVELGFDNERIVTHPVGIELEKFTYRDDLTGNDGSEDRPFEIVSVGRLVWEKAFEHGIRAIHALRQQEPNRHVRYTILGEGPQRPELERLIDELGLQGVVRLPGAAAREGVVAALRGADAYLLSSVAEVLPVVLMEAGAVGLPAVATRIAAVGEIVADGESGHLAPPGDPGALANHLATVLGDAEHRRRLGERGRGLVEQKFDVTKLNRRLVTIFEEAVREQAHQPAAPTPHPPEAAPSTR